VNCQPSIAVSRSGLARSGCFFVVSCRSRQSAEATWSMNTQMKEREREWINSEDRTTRRKVSWRKDTSWAREGATTQTSLPTCDFHMASEYSPGTRRDRQPFSLYDQVPAQSATEVHRTLQDWVWSKEKGHLKVFLWPILFLERSYAFL